MQREYDRVPNKTGAIGSTTGRNAEPHNIGARIANWVAGHHQVPVHERPHQRGEISRHPDPPTC
jgi:hypothetical protein